MACLLRRRSAVPLAGGGGRRLAASLFLFLDLSLCCGDDIAQVELLLHLEAKAWFSWLLKVIHY
jgi:hypothetical protein